MPLSALPLATPTDVCVPTCWRSASSLAMLASGGTPAADSQLQRRPSRFARQHNLRLVHPTAAPTGAPALAASPNPSKHRNPGASRCAPAARTPRGASVKPIRGSRSPAISRKTWWSGAHVRAPAPALRPAGLRRAGLPRPSHMHVVIGGCVALEVQNGAAGPPWLLPRCTRKHPPRQQHSRTAMDLPP